MRHVTCEHKLVFAGRLEVLFQVGAGEGTRLLLVNELLVALGLQFGEFFGEIGVGCEDRGTGRSVVDDCDGSAVWFVAAEQTEWNAVLEELGRKKRCLLWTRGAPAARYFSSSAEMAFRVEATFSVLRCPVAYLYPSDRLGHRDQEQYVLVLGINDDEHAVFRGSG